MRARVGLRALLPLCAGVLAAALTASLGNWQLRRAEEKSALQAQLDALARRPAQALRAAAPSPPEGLRLSLAGQWRAEAGILLDNRTHGGRAGYHVLTPLVLADGSGAVLVNRGWVAAAPDRRLPEIAPPPPGLQRIEGRLQAVQPAPFTLAAAPADEDGRLWQALELERYAALRPLAGEAGVALPLCAAAMPERTGGASEPVGAQAAAPAAPCLARWVVQQTSSAADGLVRDWPAPSAGVDRHRGYAVQWYALAALAAGLSAWYAGRIFLRRLGDERKPRLAGH